jgi:hypothetical protein
LRPRKRTSLQFDDLPPHFPEKYFKICPSVPSVRFYRIASRNTL